MMIARALMHAPAVLFLDEPSTGLDPAARLFLWEKVAELKASGTTVVITTHDMEEAATLSDRVAIIDHGTLLALDTPAALVRDMAGERTLDCTVEPATGRPGRRPPRWSQHRLPSTGVSETERLEDPGISGWRFRVYVEGDPATFVAPVAQVVSAAGGRLIDVRLGEPNLEDVFIHLTGKGTPLTADGRCPLHRPSGVRAPTRSPPGPWRTGLAILRRDLFVTGHEFPLFLAQVILQPLFLLLVFGKVLTELGYATPGLRVGALSRALWPWRRSSPACRAPRFPWSSSSPTATRSRTACSPRSRSERSRWRRWSLPPCGVSWPPR